MADFDDAPQWYWAASDAAQDGLTGAAAGDRFIVACGQRELWARARSELKDDHPGWNSFGSEDGKATLADCMRVFLSSREGYGVNYNRLTTELARVEAWARFIKDAPSDLCNWISNPISREALPRPPYDRAAERELGLRIASTLGLDEAWWL